jgi:alkylated DNA repair dioxygenase AlkB
MTATLRETGALWLDETFWPEPGVLFATLLTSVAWDERIRARKSASFGLPYNYSGITWPAVPFPEPLHPVLATLTPRLGYTPNNCLANYYLDGSSTMGYHADATDNLVPGTGIAILSLGAPRTLTFRHNQDRQRLERYLLAAGSLLFMTAALQADWKHAILADEVPGGRISLTFRCLMSSE